MECPQHDGNSAVVASAAAERFQCLAAHLAATASWAARGDITVRVGCHVTPKVDRGPVIRNRQLFSPLCPPLVRPRFVGFHAGGQTWKPGLSPPRWTVRGPLAAFTCPAAATTHIASRDEQRDGCTKGTAARPRMSRVKGRRRRVRQARRRDTTSCEPTTSKEITRIAESRPRPARRLCCAAERCLTSENTTTTGIRRRQQRSTWHDKQPFFSLHFCSFRSLALHFYLDTCCPSFPFPFLSVTHWRCSAFLSLPSSRIRLVTSLKLVKGREREAYSISCLTSHNAH